MSNEVFRKVQYNDGEGLTFGDFNDGQDFLHAVIWDKIIQNLIGNVKLTGTMLPGFSGNNGVDAPTHLAYCLHGGSAYVRPGSATNAVQIAPGVLMQKVGSTDGSAATVLAYEFQGTEQVTIATGNATNPRVDLVQMSLAVVSGDLQSRDFQDATTHVVSTQSMNKKKYVSCTLAVKQGTAGATPVVPDPDAGYVAVATVYVQTNYATTTQLDFGKCVTGGARAFVADQRMPLNVQTSRTDPNAMYKQTAWFINTNDVSVAASNATNELLIPNSRGGNIARLVAVSGYAANVTDSANNRFQRVVMDAGFAPIASAINTIPVGLSAVGKYQIPYYTFEGNYVDPDISLPFTQSTTNKIGFPIWSNGCFAPYVASTQIAFSGDIGLGVQLRIVSGQTPSTISAVDWHWACGI